MAYVRPRSTRVCAQCLQEARRYNLLLTHAPTTQEDFMSATHTEEAHTGPIKNPKQLLMAVFFSFVVPVFVIIGLVQYVSSADKAGAGASQTEMRSEEHTSELQSQSNLVCRLLLEKKKTN